MRSPNLDTFRDPGETVLDLDTFRDPVKGKALAVSQISAGADIIYHAAGTTGHGVFEAARDMGA